jgi:uridylate kinase
MLASINGMALQGALEDKEMLTRLQTALKSKQVQNLYQKKSSTSP